MNRVELQASALILALCTVNCAAIEFERGPYAIRDLEVVYSEQEDVTFLSWRLRQDAQLNLVEFELWFDGDYVPIEVADAPFAAEPRKCGSTWCFQYQVPGRLALPGELSPMRSVHRDDGVFMGPAPRERQVLQTFNADPLALGKNDAIDPRRFDWFADNSVPLTREYEWHFTGFVNGRCDDPAEGWTRAASPIEIEREWVERASDAGICFHFRPRRSDAPSVWVTDILYPSAETHSELKTYGPARVDAPIVWGMLVDLHVPDESRCRQVKGTLIDIVERQIGARGDDTKLGVYTPTDSTTGETLSGCDQVATRDYPIDDMLRDAKTVRGELEPEQTRVLWVVANNIELPPSQRILDQLEFFGLALVLGDDFDPENPDFEDVPIPGSFGEDVGVGALGTTAYTWVIGSNVFMSLLPWDITTPWRPIEDQTFAADIRASARATLPFATMRHEFNTQVEITPPPTVVGRPRHFRICEASPFEISAIGIDPAFAAYPPTATVPWPEFDDTSPYYLVDIPPQILVPRTDYVRRVENAVIEVCTAFCDGPFRSRGGADFPRWSQTEACQWDE